VEQICASFSLLKNQDIDGLPCVHGQLTGGDRVWEPLQWLSEGVGERSYL